MIVAFLILIVGLLPPLFSLWVLRQADARAQERLRLAMESVANRRLSTLRLTDPQSDRQYVEGIGYIIGDLTCRFNARSHYLRCAVNPIGPCEACSHYQPKDDRI